MKKIYNEENISFYLNFLFLNKQKKYLNELNSLVAIVVVISLVIKINELVRVYFSLSPEKLSIVKFF